MADLFDTPNEPLLVAVVISERLDYPNNHITLFTYHPNVRPVEPFTANDLVKALTMGDFDLIKYCFENSAEDVTTHPYLSIDAAMSGDARIIDLAIKFNCVLSHETFVTIAQKCPEYLEVVFEQLKNRSEEVREAMVSGFIDVAFCSNNIDKYNSACQLFLRFGETYDYETKTFTRLAPVGVTTIINL
jgi:hypothetical protein